MAIMLITHDLGVIAEMATDVAVMYLGRVVEQAPVDADLPRPAASVYAGAPALHPPHSIAHASALDADRGRRAASRTTGRRGAPSIRAARTSWPARCDRQDAELAAGRRTSTP